MQHITYGSDPSAASIALLVKERSFHVDRIKNSYILPLEANPEAFIAYSLWYNDANKAPAAMAKDYLATVLTSLRKLNIKVILVADGPYFKYLTGHCKAASEMVGYSLPSKLKGFEDEFTVFYAPNYQATKYNVHAQVELDNALKAFKRYLTGNYSEPGINIIKSANYPRTPKSIQAALNDLLQAPQLAVDIETKGLQFWNCGLATITFSTDRHTFVSFPIDRGFFVAEAPEQTFPVSFGSVVKKLLKQFFVSYKGNLIAHNANFDFKVLVYELWMGNLQDYFGMIQGIEILAKNFEDTKIVAYLATNNAVENKLGLKILAAPYTGNYAEDVKDTMKVPLDKLLTYNGIDGLATWYVWETYYPKMVADGQESLYPELFKPSIVTLLQTELVGMPICLDKVAKVKHRLTRRKNFYTDYLKSSKLMQEYLLDYKSKKCAQFTAEAKKKVFKLDDPRITRLKFNPASAQQKAYLLYKYLGLPVLDYTDTKEPATGAKTLEKLLNHTDKKSYREIIKALIGLAKVEKILSSFIPAFEGAVLQPDGTYRLYGNFNLGGTVSGRLSSSDPNLTNIPSGSTYGKMIKECFGLTGLWLFAGADFNSLEDMVSALTTRDTNKMKVYEGHTIYRLDIDGKTQHIRDDSLINYNGKTYTAKAFHDSLLLNKPPS